MDSARFGSTDDYDHDQRSFASNHFVGGVKVNNICPKIYDTGLPCCYHVIVWVRHLAAGEVRANNEHKYCTFVARPISPPNEFRLTANFTAFRVYRRRRLSASVSG